MMIKNFKNWKFDRKMAKQRAKKGYCDLDVWNINTFIEEKLVAMLKEFIKQNDGYPSELTPDEWNNILNRMIFLLTEMNEETCSMQFAIGNTVADSGKRYMEICEYRNNCKNEFYDLLKEWHWALWW